MIIDSDIPSVQIIGNVIHDEMTAATQINCLVSDFYYIGPSCIALFMAK
ncbi:MAG: hypothetical protein ACTS85_04690 [Arsenophonus sp. NC-PG7-MAG3]